MKELITELGQNQSEVNKLIKRDDYMARLNEKAPEPAYRIKSEVNGGGAGGSVISPPLEQRKGGGQ